MLTFASWPKPFDGQAAVTQRTAIESWAQLTPMPQVLLFGDDKGVGETARSLGLDHIPEIARNPSGTALLDDLMAKVRGHAEHRFVCLANADVIFFEDLPSTVARVSTWHSRFLLIGRCTEIDEFPNGTELAELRRRAVGAPLREPGALDYFVFSRDLYADVPPFAMGRAGFDNWLVWRARDLGVPVFDATHFVTALHPRHGYEHLRGGRASAYAGPEAQANVLLAGGWSHLYNIHDANYRVTTDGARRNWLGLLRTIGPVRDTWLAGSRLVRGARKIRPGNLMP